MKFKTTFLLIVTGIAFCTSLFAQKIGYANIDALLKIMPESQSMQQVLTLYQAKLMEKLEIKKQNFQSQVTAYVELKKMPQDLLKMQALESELAKLQNEIKIETASVEHRVKLKKAELITPILQKFQAAIDSISKDEGYDYILNSVDSAGMSIILHGPQEHDLTEKLIRRLGIQILED